MEKAPGQLEIVLRFFDEFSTAETRQMAALGDLYAEWNAKINVISRKDIDSLYEKHILHSLAIAAAFDFKPDMEVIDIGTGGGFPGIPLAIFFPRTRFHLVDSIGKKIKVVDAVAAALGLTNVSTWHGRAEEIKNRKFDVAVSRAVAPLKDLWAWSRPLLRKSRFGRRSLGEGGPAANPATRAPDASANPISSEPNPSNPISFEANTPNTPTSPEPNTSTNPNASGLICLKGGDLAAEISESGLRPRILDVYQLFPLDSFHEKYLLQVPY